MSAFALWQRLDTPGHDAALLTQHGESWSLRGTAVFKHEDGPACIGYTCDLDASWQTTGGTVRGFVADRVLDHVIRRAPEGWYLDEVLIDGLGHLVDLDYGFTPATNLQQLRRVSPTTGQVVDLPVAWFDIGAPTLTELLQSYERRDEATYWYQAPGVPYEALLELSPNGFVSRYPRLWNGEC